MQEDLLGYLLGALEPHEMRRIAQLLEEDPELRLELAELERALEPLEDGLEAMSDPMPDLVARTMASLPEHPLAESADAESFEESDSQRYPFGVRTALQDRQEYVDRKSWTWADLVGGAAATAILLGLLVSFAAAQPSPSPPLPFKVVDGAVYLRGELRAPGQRIDAHVQLAGSA